MEFAFRLLAAGHRIRYTPDVVMMHRTAPEGREAIQEAYRLVRNRVYIALKHLPLPYLLSHLAVWSGFACWEAVRGRQLGEFVRGLTSLRADGLLRQALAYRRAHPMPAGVVRYLRENEGRLWY